MSNMYGCTGISNSNSNQVGTPDSPLLAKLNARGVNGGPTQTVLPMNDSPAVNFFDYDGCASDVNRLDQRGFVRSSPCDSGSVEVGAAFGPSKRATRKSVTRVRSGRFASNSSSN